MTMNVSDVLSAYKKTGGVIDDASASGAPSSGTQSFSSMLSGAMGDAVNSLHAGENAAVSAVSGKADMATVVTAMDNAEVILDEVTALRDKMITAYQTITSSAI